MGMKALQSQKTLDESSSASSLIEDLKREFRNQTFADLTLICKGFSFPWTDSIQHLQQRLGREYPITFLERPYPSSFLFILLFPNKHFNFYSKNLRKNVHPVYSAGIRTQNIQSMSLLP